LKEIIIVYGVKNLSDTLQNKNFKISICFFSSQGDPALLEPWLVYTIVFLIANTILYIFMAVPMFATVASTALAYIIVTGVAISFCK